MSSRPAKLLGDGHGSAAAVGDAVPTRTPTQKPEHRADVHGDERATQIVVPRR